MTSTQTFQPSTCAKGFETHTLSHQLQAAARLYEIFVKTPQTRGSGSYMLEDTVNDVFHKGGQGLVQRMKKYPPGPNFTHWNLTLRADIFVSVTTNPSFRSVLNPYLMTWFTRRCRLYG